MDYIVDTSFLIGLWRQPHNGPEAKFLDAHADCVLGIPWIVKGEFLAGAHVAGHDATRVASFLASYPLLLPNENTATLYAHLYAALYHPGKKVAVNDLWIATAAIEANCPLLTRNLRDFVRVERLQIVNYIGD